MEWAKPIAITLALVVVSTFAVARTPRNEAAVHQFRAAHPCPSTGKTTGHCTGWIIDHRVALCVGGKDEASNLRWQTFDKSHDKDKWECKKGWQEKLAACEKNGCYSP